MKRLIWLTLRERIVLHFLIIEAKRTINNHTAIIRERLIAENRNNEAKLIVINNRLKFPHERRPEI